MEIDTATRDDGDSSFRNGSGQWIGQGTALVM